MKDKGFCKVCGFEIEVQMCCSGYMCGCMGQPIDPPVCSEDCYDELMNNIGKYYPQNGVKIELKKMEKTQLEIGDKIRRFEVQLTREIDTIYEIASVTKTLAKTKDGKSFFRELNFNSTKPEISKNKILAEVQAKGVKGYSAPRFYLIEESN